MPKRRYPLNKLPNLLKNPPPDVDIMLYDKNSKEPHPGDNTVKKSRLDQLEERMDRFEERMNRLEELIIKLTEEMRNGFKQVNTRIDKIETRIDRIDARLDYNGLKRLPVDNK